jgi:cell fate (sporulation/competence/biofilm development) regulator YmcA (YheA/YmcA/DUF963 family)
MKALNELLDLIRNDEAVQHFKKLEYIIDHDEKLTNEYQSLLELQKHMVQLKYNNSSEYIAVEKQYNQKLTQVMDNLFLGEYLDLVKELNEDLKLIASIIEMEISKDFD